MHLDATSHPFTLSSALAAGVTEGTLRGADFVIATRGTRIGAARHALDPRAALLESLVPIARDDQFFSHTTAARIHGMPLPARLEHDAIHVACPGPAPRMRRAGVVGHRVKAIVVEIDGFRVESPADAFVHIGTTSLTVDELIEVGDWIVHPRRASPMAVAELREHVRSFTGARGMRRVMAAIPSLRVGSDSPGETRTRLMLQRSGLPEPVLQHRVLDRSGAPVATLDLAYPDRLVGLEYDGAHHRLDSEQFAFDVRRIARLDALGWRIVRVTHEDVRDRGRRILPLIRAGLERSSGRFPSSDRRVVDGR